MASPLEETFEMMLDAREEATGIREKVTFRGLDRDVLIPRMGDEFSPGAGGIDLTQDLVICLRKTDVVAPVQCLDGEADGEAIVVRGKTLKILEYWPLEGRVELLVGTGTKELQED